MENISVKLPDGSIKQLPKGSTGLDLALSIGPGLAKDAVAIEINNIQKDLSDTLEDNSSVSIITIKSNEGLEIMRHTLAAQVLASAPTLSSIRSLSDIPQVLSEIGSSPQLFNALLISSPLTASIPRTWSLINLIILLLLLAFMA